jgi:hypothetical protein
MKRYRAARDRIICRQRKITRSIPTGYAPRYYSSGVGAMRNCHATIDAASQKLRESFAHKNIQHDKALGS